MENYIYRITPRSKSFQRKDISILTMKAAEFKNRFAEVGRMSFQQSQAYLS